MRAVAVAGCPLSPCPPVPYPLSPGGYPLSPAVQCISSCALCSAQPAASQARWIGLPSGSFTSLSARAHLDRAGAGAQRGGRPRDGDVARHDLTVAEFGVLEALYHKGRCC
jgi:hypothetical protein